jgi:hypothetical protein
MQEQASIITPNKISQQLLRLPSTTLHIDSAQDSDNILEQELSVVRPAILQALLSRPRHLALTRLCFVCFWVQKAEDAQFSADPLSSARNELLVAVE